MLLTRLSLSLVCLYLTFARQLCATHARSYFYAACSPPPLLSFGDLRAHASRQHGAARCTRARFNDARAACMFSMPSCVWYAGLHLATGSPTLSVFAVHTDLHAYWITLCLSVSEQTAFSTGRSYTLISLPPTFYLQHRQLYFCSATHSNTYLASYTSLYPPYTFRCAAPLYCTHTTCLLFCTYSAASLPLPLGSL